MVSIFESEAKLRNEDGVSHINVHLEFGLTGLGRDLSPYASVPFEHPYLGRFKTFEGFWWYIRGAEHKRSLMDRHDELRSMSGTAARNFGQRHYRGSDVDLPLFFQEDALAGLYQKIIQTPRILAEFKVNKLPFMMYYMHRQSGLLTKVPEGAWLLEGLNVIRNAIQSGKVPDFWKKAEARYQQLFARPPGEVDAEVVKPVKAQKPPKQRHDKHQKGQHQQNVVTPSELVNPQELQAEVAGETIQPSDETLLPDDIVGTGPVVEIAEPAEVATFSDVNSHSEFADREDEVANTTTIYEATKTKPVVHTTGYIYVIPAEVIAGENSNTVEEQPAMLVPAPQEPASQEV